ncbi:hypothetical protein ACEPAF_3373 [Sanghuangporus sanghuang]
MSSVHIRALLQGPDLNRSINYAINTLNSSFPSFQHVNCGTGLADAINEARASSEDYDIQLVASQENLRKLIHETRSRAKEQLVTAQELSLLRHSLSDEVSSLTEELESTTTLKGSELSLLEEIETLHRNLRELENVKGYVQIIHRALQLSEQTIQSVEQVAPTASLSEVSLADYVLLQQLVHGIRKTCEQAKNNTGQDVKLVSFLADLVDKTWLRMKDVLSSTLLSAAEGLHWPMPVDFATANVDVRRAFERAFSNLLKLQEIAISGEKLNTEGEDTGSSKDGIYPFQALVRPISQRFKYHFEGTRQTNRLDKPEWYFAHILNVSHEHRLFLESVIQRLLQSSRYSSINAWREFTRLLLPILGRKIKRSMPTLLAHPPLLAHTIYQSLAFDEALREARFDLVGTLDKTKKGPRKWEGTSNFILGNKDWFDAWLEGERKFAEDQFNDIITSPDTWHISDDTAAESDESEVRPTNSARRVKALIERITDRYRTLPRLEHKTRFLTDVQILILEMYHSRISDSLDAFETLSSFLVRAVPGALVGQPSHGMNGKNLTAGVESSQRLIKAYVSSRWIVHVMSSWGEDIFFLELWQQIREDISLWNQIKSIGALPDPSVVNDEGTIFEALIFRYNKLAEHAEDLLVKQITGEVEADLKAHLFKQPDPSEGEDTVISQTLLKPIAQLSAHLSFLTKCLPLPMAINLYRRIAGHIANHILQRQVLYRGRSRMSLKQGREVLEEAILWVEACRMAMGSSGLRRVEGPWERLLEAGRLLSLEEEAFQQMGATLEVLKYGATIISWKAPKSGSNDLVEQLFISSKAALDGSKPVRGGIPIVFPCFGAPTRPEHSKLPQHGYARNSTWQWDGQTLMDNDVAVSIRLTLTPEPSMTSDRVVLAYVITLSEHQLNTDLHVINTSSDQPLTFQALLHTYIRAPKAAAHIDGLQNLTFLDKTIAGNQKFRESRAVADVHQFTDYVYEDGPREYTVTWPDGGLKVKAIGFKDVVLWNPGPQKGSEISDMEEGGWERFLCLEPGYVADFNTIRPGETWIGGQTLTPIRSPGTLSV